MPKKGMFLVIEGTDGSGKGEQTRRLVERLQEEGYPVATFDFPRYGQPSAWFVEQYLNGAFGELREVSPKTASLFYALDRYAAGPEIRAALAAGKVVISNRYVASNLGHQGSKMEKDERRKFFDWNVELEYEANGIPRPDLNLILHVDAGVAQKLVDQKAERRHLNGKKRDLHEADLDHLRRTEETYREIAGAFPEYFATVECMAGDRLRSPEEVHEIVWSVVKERILQETVNRT